MGNSARLMFLALRLAITSAGVALVMMVIAFAANYLALSQGSARVENTLSQAIADGSFTDKSDLGPWGVFYTRRGSFAEMAYLTSHYDCLIWSSVLSNPPEGVLAKVIRTSRLIPNVPDAGMSDDCLAVEHALGFHGSRSDNQLSYYDHYIIGQRALAQIMLSNFSLRTSAALTRFAVCCGFLIALMLASIRRNSPIACIATVLLIFQPISLHGSVLNFAPLDIVHSVALITAIYLPFGLRSFGSLAFIGALYGSAIAIFELLTGGIPMALVILALLTGISAVDCRSFAGRYSILAGSFTIAVLACFAAKLVAVSAIYGAAAFSEFQSALVHRFSHNVSTELLPRVIESLAAYGIDAKNSLVYLMATYAYWSMLIGWGSPIFGCLLPLAGLILLFISTKTHYRQGVSCSPKLLSCWCGLGAYLAWCLVFWNHTVLHGFMMAKLLVIPFLCGSVAALPAHPWRVLKRAT